ncbi:exodeoxyribonuclease V subunit alpha [Ectothiorhodospira mobilis]|nr:exodeoxyribonuclease V subunit alpha [Ectothiorhodospira mobilis]MBK1691902.1 exodeoxyribonuclease V subunit alpha [Ectothiorhodospira mobilis]
MAGQEGLQGLLQGWVERGWLRPLDRALVVFLQEQLPAASPPALLLAALASHQVGRGHVCLDLEATLADPDRTLSLPPEGETPVDGTPPPRPSQCLAGLGMADLVSALEDPDLVGAGPGCTPLVLQGRRLYLRRYWACEQRVAGALAERLLGGAAVREAMAPERLHPWLERLFGPPDAQGIDWQRAACALAASGAFAVITGGPGTGKTTTVVRLLALLQALHLETGADVPLRIRMAAPTGKAAARLNAAVAGALGGLALPRDAFGQAVRDAIPARVTTLHRLLGSRPGSRHFRHDARRPLAVDALVVDEASMIDLELMDALLQALPPEARLILLGDRDQLASVEAGAVLGELCARAGEGHYTPERAAWLQAVTGQPLPPERQDPSGNALDQHVVMLRHSHRFGADSGIGRLARAVNAGDAQAVAAVWAEPGRDLMRRGLKGPEDPALPAVAVDGGAGDRPPRADGAHPEGYGRYLQVMATADPGPGAEAPERDAWAREVLAALEGFQVLCALRRGPWGVEGMNHRIAAFLRERGLLDPQGIWYAGRPVIVTGNDYGLGLMNGDMGVTLRVADAAGNPVLRVAFPAGDGSDRIRWVLPSRLTAVETAFALTVHKSQGSEFRHTALVLPDRAGPLLTRELVYTAITRASRWFTLLEPRRGILEEAVMRRVLRSSGLQAALEGRLERGE